MPTFKTAGGVFYTKSLFLEESYTDKSAVVYTLKDVDHEGYPSLYRLYLDKADPTEYEFSKEYLGGWYHWQMIANAAWFKPYITRWRTELELKIKAKALSNLFAVANDPYHKFHYEATKFILGNGYKPPEPKNAKGRPSKESIQEEANQYFKEAQDDLQRLKELQ